MVSQGCTQRVYALGIEKIIAIEVLGEERWFYPYRSIPVLIRFNDPSLVVLAMAKRNRG
jgi:hypothetical protein